VNETGMTFSVHSKICANCPAGSKAEKTAYTFKEHCTLISLLLFPYEKKERM
jgi:hypothetical protein